MARKSQNRKVKKVIYVFWEGESEEAYSKFLKNEFEDYAVIKCHREKGTFQKVYSSYKNDRKFKSMVEELDELWIFFDTELEMGSQWKEKQRYLNDIRKSRTNDNIKIRLLMTTGCVEYWLLLHYKKVAPNIAIPADKEKVMNERNRQIILKNPCEFVLAGISTYVSNFNFALLWCIPRQ